MDKQRQHRGRQVYFQADCRWTLQNYFPLGLQLTFCKTLPRILTHGELPAQTAAVNVCRGLRSRPSAAVRSDGSTVRWHGFLHPRHPARRPVRTLAQRPGSSTTSTSSQGIVGIRGPGPATCGLPEGGRTRRQETDPLCLLASVPVLTPPHSSRKLFW